MAPARIKAPARRAGPVDTVVAATHAAHQPAALCADQPGCAGAVGAGARARIAGPPAVGRFTAAAKRRLGFAPAPA